jgi:hypothetical protein
MATGEDRDTQPEIDDSPSELAALTMGLVLGAGLILGALLGSLAGHFWLDDAFGRGILVGAVVGAIVLASIGIAFVRLLTARVAARQ